MALKDICLNVKKDEFVSIMGLSGSGKITLLNCISGFIGANSGEILLDNKDIKEMEGRSEVLLNAFGIDGIKEKYPNEISDGQKQRVAVARALSNKPLVLLADEPTGNLDSKSSISVIELFIDEKKNLDASIFMVTYDAFSVSYSDRVVALKDGEIVKELVRKGEPREFLDEILSFMKGINGDLYDTQFNS